jgi:hypothetical protein
MRVEMLAMQSPLALMSCSGEYVGVLWIVSRAPTEP